MEHIKASIRGYLRGLWSHPMADDDDILAIGFMNEERSMHLVTYLERTFAINVEPDDLDMENFRTINAIADLVARKGGG